VKRSLALVLALLLAGVAAVGVFVYTSNVESRVRSEQAPVPVLVSTETIEAGVSLDEAVQSGLIESTVLPAAAAPSGRIASVTPSNGSLLAVSAISPGQVLLDGNFAAELPDVGPLDIPDGMVAISLELQDPERVAGFLRPGSEIGVFYTVEQQPEENAAPAATITKVLLPRVTVLAVGDATTPSEAEQPTDSGSALITLAVTQDQALRLIQGSRTGSLYLALLSPDATLSPTSSVSNDGL
jgi:pilus assembly protein CpaB